MLPLLVGEAPGRLTGSVPFSGRCGLRIAALMGVEKVEDAFRTVNLLDEWPGRSGKGSRFPRPSEEQVDRVWAQSMGAPVVVAGKRAATAMGVYLPYLRWGTRLGCAVAIIPHPSGVNRRWNGPGNADRVSLFLRCLATTSPTRTGPGSSRPPGG